LGLILGAANFGEARRAAFRRRFVHAGVLAHLDASQFRSDDRQPKRGSDGS
jgi:hypothetical protein